MTESVDDLLADAIIAGHVLSVATTLATDPDRSEDDRARAAAAAGACRRIGEICDAEQRRLRESFASTGLDVAGQASGPRQFFTLRLDLPSSQHVDSAIACLAAEGYQPWTLLNSAAWRAYRRCRDHLVLGKADELTMRVDLHWPASGFSRLPWLPTNTELHRYHLPPWAWPAHLLSPLWRITRRLGHRASAPMGTSTVTAPFLGTPPDLVLALLALLELTEDDVLVDLGCGDGRVLAMASETIGCRSVGIENDPQRLREAEVRIASSAAADLIELRAADLSDCDLSEATAALIFLPPAALARVIPRLQASLPNGSRILAHEQSDLSSLRPERRIPVFADAALTNAYVWTAT